jgi:hypothetical protein
MNIKQSFVDMLKAFPRMFISNLFVNNRNLVMQGGIIKISLGNHCHANICITPRKLAAIMFQRAAFEPFENKLLRRRSQFMRMAHNGERERVLPKVHQHNSDSDSCVLCANNTPPFCALLY